MKKRTDLHFAVIGIGAFGSALANKLSEEGAYVIAVDSSMDRLNEVKSVVSDAICFDATDPELLESHGICDVDVAVIAMGESFEPVVLIAMQLLNAGVKEVYGRASTKTQVQILKQIGITDVIHPERQVAERMGVMLVRSGLSDIFDLGEGLALFEVEAPKEMIGYTLADLELRSRYELNLITIKRYIEDVDSDDIKDHYKPIGILTGKTTVHEKDRFLLVGSKDNCDRLLRNS